MDHRWVVRVNDGTTVAKLHVASGRFSVKLKDATARAKALALDGASEDGVEWYIDIPRSHEDEWAALVARAAGASAEPERIAAGPSRAVTPSSSGSGGTIASELERLMQLHAKGGLTDEEFQQAKARVLAE